MPDGTIPEGAKEVLRGIGSWLETNGEAIFETTPWKVPGEGPSKVVGGGAFTEATEIAYTGQDIRYTVKGDTLYAHCLGWPGPEVTLQAPAKFLYPGEIISVRMLGSDEPLAFRQTPEALSFATPKERVGDHAFVFKIQRRDPYV
jgi:alpha-L-fucosidase